MKSNSDGLMIDGIIGYIDRDNIDTDQIIPTEYLKSIKKFENRQNKYETPFLKWIFKNPFQKWDL